MNSLYDLSQLPSAEPNPMVRKVGKHEGATCASCASLVRVEHHDKHYIKCRKRGMTHGKGTDHRCKWSACAYYQKEIE